MKSAILIVAAVLAGSAARAATCSAIVEAESGHARVYHITPAPTAKTNATVSRLYATVEPAQMPGLLGMVDAACARGIANAVSVAARGAGPAAAKARRHLESIRSSYPSLVSGVDAAGERVRRLALAHEQGNDLLTGL